MAGDCLEKCARSLSFLCYTLPSHCVERELDAAENLWIAAFHRRREHGAEGRIPRYRGQFITGGAGDPGRRVDVGVDGNTAAGYRALLSRVTRSVSQGELLLDLPFLKKKN